MRAALIHLMSSLFVLTGGTIGHGKSANWVGIGIHQIEEKRQQRSFTLRETATLVPVPLPAALPLLLSGLAIIGCRGAGAADPLN